MAERETTERETTDHALADPEVFRHTMRSWATGLSVVTTRGRDGRPLGMLVNSLAPVSLRPPLVSWSVDRASSRHRDWEACGGFAIHILAAHQADLVDQFRRRDIDRFTGLAWSYDDAGLPVLADAAAVLTCRRIRSLPVGDHTLLVAEVTGVRSDPDAVPLMFLDGRVLPAPQPLSCGDSC